MADDVTFYIDGRPCTARAGDNLVEAAAANGAYIPTLCFLKGHKPLGTCRVCAVRVDGREVAACTFGVHEGMRVDVDVPELADTRKALIELLFVERNHFCPACEKSGRCDLQAVAYHMHMTVPRFPYRYTPFQVENFAGKLLIDHNRCILCGRCEEFVRCGDNGGKVFAMKQRSADARITVDPLLLADLTADEVAHAVSICPVGAILEPGRGFDTPIGQRKYDKHGIGEVADGRD